MGHRAAREPRCVGYNEAKSHDGYFPLVWQHWSALMGLASGSGQTFWLPDVH